MSDVSDEIVKQRIAASEELTYALYKCAKLTGTVEAFMEFVSSTALSVFMIAALGEPVEKLIEALRNDEATMPGGKA